MNEDDVVFTRCVRHPSQFFTGFCSSCLVERLSSVENNNNQCQRSLGDLHSVESEIVEVLDVDSCSEIKPGETRVRKTLQLLFQLDDAPGVEIEEHHIAGQRGLLSANMSGSVGVSNRHECSNAEASSSSGRAVESNASVTGDAAEGANNGSCLDDDILNKGWLSSMLAKKKLKWRSMSVSRREECHDRCKSCARREVSDFAATPNLRHSCDWRLCHHSNKNSLDPPRHSWDGSMVTKAFACSFACLEEKEDDSRKIKRRLPNQPVTEAPNQTSGDDDKREQADAETLTNEKPISSSEGSLGELFSERGNEEPLPEANMLKIRRKKVHMWSKVWDWSITSPFRDLVKKRDNASERSLSETWREGRNGRSTERADTETGTQVNSVAVNSARISQVRHRSVNIANTSSKNSRPDWQKKRDFQLSRSRTVHYSSPGNFDSGLLRFYLTPLRSSRRCTSRSRGRRSRSFAKGIFGFH